MKKKRKQKRRVPLQKLTDMQTKRIAGGGIATFLGAIGPRGFDGSYRSYGNG